jgi:polysaccharide biosynthesis transport protein
VLAHLPYDSGRVTRREKQASPLGALDEKLSIIHRPRSAPAEVIRSLRTAFFMETATTQGKILQVTSAQPADGKTTVCGNLACAIAQAGKRVVVVDADLRRPQLSANFGLTADQGLTNVLNGDCDPDSVISTSPVARLDVIPSGPVPANPADALVMPEMVELIEWLRDRYDYVLIDTPPILAVTDPCIVANYVDYTLLTMRIRRGSRLDAKEAVSNLRGCHSKLLGIVVNSAEQISGSIGYRVGQYAYGRYGYETYGQYGSSSAKTNGKAASEEFLIQSRRPEAPTARPVRAKDSETVKV